MKQLSETEMSDGDDMPPKQPTRPQTSITFYGEDIVALLELDPNETYVPVAELCERLGLDRAAEERSVRAHTILAAGTRTLVVEDDDGRRPMLCLRADLTPLWLTGVDAARVAEPARAQIELFQRECASALWQAFRPQGFGPEDELLPVRHEQTAAEHRRCQRSPVPAVWPIGSHTTRRVRSFRPTPGAVRWIRR